MICKTIGQMNGIAKNGAATMLNEGFSFSAINTAGMEGMYEVVTAKGTTYRVDPTTGKGGFCSCPFHRNNRRFCPFTTCKHVLALREELAREAEYENYLNEIAEGGQTVQAGAPSDLQTATWPRCEACGDLFDEAVCGLPLDLCDRCEKRAFI